jgi:hypothetical protein
MSLTCRDIFPAPRDWWRKPIGNRCKLIVSILLTLAAISCYFSLKYKVTYALVTGDIVSGFIDYRISSSHAGIACVKFTYTYGGISYEKKSCDVAGTYFNRDEDALTFLAENFPIGLTMIAVDKASPENAHIANSFGHTDPSEILEMISAVLALISLGLIYVEKR